VGSGDEVGEVDAVVLLDGLVVAIAVVEEAGEARLFTGLASYDIRSYSSFPLARGGMVSRITGRGPARGAGGRGGPRRPGMKGGAHIVLEPQRHPGIFIAKGKEHLLVTKNLVPGESVYGEKRISIDGGVDGTKVEYRVWNPFRSKLAAGVLGGLDDIFIKPGKKVLYLGAASGTSVSHVADIVGPVSFLRLLLCPIFIFSCG
jgi:hypothetical protein